MGAITSGSNPVELTDRLLQRFELANDGHMPVSRSSIDCACLSTSAARSCGTTTPSSSATMMSPGRTVTPAHSTGTFLATVLTETGSDDLDRRKVTDRGWDCDPALFPQVLRDGQGEMDIRFRHFKTGAARWMAYKVLTLTDVPPA